MDIERFNTLNNINIIIMKINALLDLMMSSENCVDHSSIKTTAEMSLTLLDELSAEFEKLNNLKSNKEV